LSIKIIISVIVIIFFFILLFIIGEQLGFMDESKITDFIISHRNSKGSIFVVSCIVVSLLAIDLVLPIPSSIVMVISGQLLGFFWGGLISFIGAMLSALIGYFLCRIGGQKMFTRFIGDKEVNKIDKWYENYGIFAIILSRPIPMLTEILSCLAGLSKVKFGLFVLAAAFGTLPICFVYSYFGNQSDIHNPWSAIWISLLLPALGWIILRQIKKKKY